MKSKAKTTAPLWPCDFAGNPVRSRAASRDPTWNLCAPGRAGGGGTFKAALRVVLGPEAWGGGCPGEARIRVRGTWVRGTQFYL